MRILFGVKCGLLLVSLLSATGFAFGCDQLSAGQSLWIRLAAPVSSYTAKIGDPVHAVLTQDLVCDQDVLLPMGSSIEGVVRSKRKVGWGIRHETAALELEFNRARIEPDATVEFISRVEGVENAREPVRKGIIQGIRSSDTFQGSINSRLIHLPTWNPYSDPVLIAYKAIFPVFPEPEIYYPTGTDLHLRTTTEISQPSLGDGGPRESSLASEIASERFEHLVAKLPWRVTTRKNVDADIINIVFLGSQDVVKSAFRAAGWDNADPVSSRSVMKNLYALLNKSSYARQPMMTFYLNGRPDDMKWQKGLNSYDRRDHLRIWQWTTGETTEPVWISSSTRDIGAALAVKHKGFVHHVAPEIDEERSAIIRDLNFAGCVRSVSYVSRPDVPNTTRNAIGDTIRTDGAVALVALQDCRPSSQLASKPPEGFKAGNHAFRFVRRQILTFHSDILRANVIYASYDVGRMAWTAIRH